MVNSTLNSTINSTVNNTINQTAIAAVSAATGLPFTGSLILDIYIVSLANSLVVSLINKNFTDQVKVKALKKEVKDLRKKHRELMMKEPKKAQQVQQELMQKSMEQMKHTMNFKVMLITMIPSLIIITLLSRYYGPFGDFWDLGFTTFGWFGTYLTFAILNSIVVRKILKLA
jgi:uncharacterized membrane protein (DUF106 family)